jgi:hypothetical protein
MQPFGCMNNKQPFGCMSTTLAARLDMGPMLAWGRAWVWDGRILL